MLFLVSLHSWLVMILPRCISLWTRQLSILQERDSGARTWKDAYAGPADKCSPIVSSSLLGLRFSVGELNEVCEQLLKPLVSKFPRQPSEGPVPLQKRILYFQ